MQHSEFQALLRQAFGAVYASTVYRDLVLRNFSDLTVAQAVAEGEDLKKIWAEVCALMDVPAELFWLKEEKESS